MTDQRLTLILLAVLSVVALIGGLVLNLEIAINLAAVGIGAFAAAVNNLWSKD
jgi:hypothetical protein